MIKLHRRTATWSKKSHSEMVNGINMHLCVQKDLNPPPLVKTPQGDEALRSGCGRKSRERTEERAQTVNGM